jgi:hypothetical protein
MNLRDIIAAAKRAADEEGVRGAHRACYLILEHQMPRDLVLEALYQIGDGPRGEPDAVEEQVDVDEFNHVHHFESWLEWADGSILSPDGDEVIEARDIHARAAEERQACKNAVAEALGEAQREQRGLDS